MTAMSAAPVPLCSMKSTGPTWPVRLHVGPSSPGNRWTAGVEDAVQHGSDDADHRATGVELLGDHRSHDLAHVTSADPDRGFLTPRWVEPDDDLIGLALDTRGCP
ncbi:MAG: hypothetical protein M3186_14425 [Actinomycetota bacterium]|nr:hypothetical protein [Actinomycetota bacterium]